VSRLKKNCKKRRLKNYMDINTNMEKIGRLTRCPDQCPEKLEAKMVNQKSRGHLCVGHVVGR
jgi:hypothetical protein